MPDDRLKTFLAVVRCGSLTRASKELYISQPAVTLQIHKLEREYNSTLFYRRERGVELTPAGKLLYDYAKRIDGIYNEAAEELSALSGSVEGALRVGATLTIGEYVLPPVMGQFKAEYPHVDILLEVENTSRIVEQVASGVLDFGLVEGPFENATIRAEKLADDELVLVCSSRHKFAGTADVDLESILKEPFILREPGSGTRRVFEDALVKAGIRLEDLKVLMQLGSTHAIKALVAENIGISVLSKCALQNEIKNGTHQCLNIPSVDLHRAFQIIFRNGERVSLMARHFVQACRRLAGSC
ncbi:MAG TPA: selenium metabolism-associated LysR family transcriptional regulator [Armatimonadota bacterium]|jgi:DNA-binding transcriptional LysR family regulator